MISRFGVKKLEILKTFASSISSSTNLIYPFARAGVVLGSGSRPNTGKVSSWSFYNYTAGH